MSNTKNDIAWQQLFDKYNILEKIRQNGTYIISSKTINVYREARLMTKFDHRSHLPALFTTNQLSILPISRGDYVIAPFETFHTFDNNIVPLSRVNPPSNIQSIDFQNITSETTAIYCAFLSGMLADFMREDNLQPTVSGRMSSSFFDFKIDSTKINPLSVTVENAQIEIDGGYEGSNALCLIEAKNTLSKDFLIRQLYYPYRLWQSKMTKKVIPIFLTYTNGIFHLRQYEFKELAHYNSIRLVHQRKYILSSEKITLQKLKRALIGLQLEVEPPIPFPQADYFERVINLCELLNQSPNLTKSFLTENYDFDDRQTNYYTDAGRYLGIINRTKKDGITYYALTTKGKALFRKSITERQIAYAQLILAHGVFWQVFQLYLKNDKLPDKQEIMQLMQQANLYKMNAKTTFQRRSSTVISWINWIINLIEE